MTTPVKRPVILMRDIVKTYYIGQPNELEILHRDDGYQLLAGTVRMILSLPVATRSTRSERLSPVHASRSA